MPIYEDMRPSDSRYEAHDLEPTVYVMVDWKPPSKRTLPNGVLPAGHSPPTGPKRPLPFSERDMGPPCDVP
jgi:hypothetical protein